MHSSVADDIRRAIVRRREAETKALRHRQTVTTGMAHHRSRAETPRIVMDAARRHRLPMAGRKSDEPPPHKAVAPSDGSISTPDTLCLSRPDAGGLRPAHPARYGCRRGNI